MKVHLLQIPQGGNLHLEGEEDAAFLGLEEAGASAAGPLRYNLDIGTSDGGLFATGSLAVRVRFTCVVTLEPFEKEISIPDFATRVELGGAELVDLSPEIREDVHLALPAHPRSDAIPPGQFFSAEIASAENDGGQAGPWRALDQIKPKT